MKELVVLSGKGGVGKTSLTAAFAALAGKTVLADTDVDAADLHLVIEHAVVQKEDFRCGILAEIDGQKCTSCGLCATLCRFDAIRKISRDKKTAYTVNALACEGCGVCIDRCPAGAIEERERLSGEVYVSDGRFGPFVHAKLGPGGENSGKLVALVKKKARALAAEIGIETIITDGPPGIGCPVIASLAEASAILAVAEPTVSGLHDLDRILKLARHFEIAAAVCVNKADINPDLTQRIRKHADGENVPFVGTVSYDPEITHAQIAGRPVTDVNNSPAAAEIAAVWRNTRKVLHERMH